METTEERLAESVKNAAIAIEKLNITIDRIVIPKIKESVQKINKGYPHIDKH